MHEDNCLIHLTYNPENLPKDGSISKPELVKFCKRLRRKIEPIKISYYGCGEYGEKLGRPHYHIMIFGFDFKDKYLWKYRFPQKYNRFSTVNKYPLFRSPMLEDRWKFGHSAVGEITIESAGYVARYVRKKIGGEIALRHYKGLKPEFAIMSKDPAIGKTWFEKYWNDVYPRDYIHIDGQKYKPPRYYDKLLERMNFKMYEVVKERRFEKLQRLSNPELMRKQKHKRLVTKSLIREMEIGKN